jgi:hypothetical protein
MAKDVHPEPRPVPAWLDDARAYSMRTGDDPQTVFATLLAMIGRKNPQAIADAQRELEKFYPDGIRAARSRMS